MEPAVKGMRGLGDEMRGIERGEGYGRGEADEKYETKRLDEEMRG